MTVVIFSTLRFCLAVGAFFFVVSSSDGDASTSFLLADFEPEPECDPGRERVVLARSDDKGRSACVSGIPTAGPAPLFSAEC